jgi:hypothetical protein
MFQKYEEKLVKIVLDTLIFLEFTEDELIDEDCSIQMMEQISSDLLSLDDESKKSFILNINDLCKHYPEDKQDFITALPGSIGLM